MDSTLTVDQRNTLTMGCLFELFQGMLLMFEEFRIYNMFKIII
jgi:hypothetical protein